MNSLVSFASMAFFIGILWMVFSNPDFGGPIFLTLAQYGRNATDLQLAGFFGVWTGLTILFGRVHV
jgi:hypothetical protein